MTVAPIPHHQSQNTSALNSNSRAEVAHVLALKELVANLHKEQNKIQDLLSSLGFALRSFNNLNQFLELTPLMASRVTDSEGGALVLFRSNDRVSLEQLYCNNPQVSQEIRTAFELLLKDIDVSGERDQNAITQPPQFLSSLSLDERLREYLGKNIQIFSTPILVKNAESGRLYVFSSDPEYAWTQTRVKLAQLVADQTAVAIANHELTVELRSRERQDRELEIASEIQLRLLPSQCPQIKGVELAADCKTASRVGGDYYDFIPTNYDRHRSRGGNKQDTDSAFVPWSIVIGDVMGKGVPAGLIMTMTRGMLRAEVLNRHSPAQIMSHLNRVMYADLENSHRFVSMFYSEYDPKTRILSFTNAAHNPPFWWKAATGEIQKLDTWGMLIGLDIDSEYEDAQVQLAPGDTIIYYTDGFTDAVNQNGDRFEEENLYLSFRWACEHYNNSQDILNHLFDRVDKFVGAGNNNTDDMTLVVMRISE